MADPIVRIGIGGWTYAPWRGEFYPLGLAQSKEQAFAAASFGAIEITHRRAWDGSRSSARPWKAGRDSYIFLINGSKLRAPAAALALQQRLGIARAAA